MKLLGSPGSPYARKVRITAIETKLDKKIEMVNVVLTPVAANPDVDKHNPIGKIPALSVKGMDLFDSPVICEYLDSHHKGRKLLPRKGRDRWVALRLQALADGKETVEPFGSQLTYTSDIVNDESHCMVFDARNPGDGPVARVRLPERICSGTHAYWADAATLTPA